MTYREVTPSKECIKHANHHLRGSQSSELTLLAINRQIRYEGVDMLRVSRRSITYSIRIGDLVRFYKDVVYMRPYITKLDFRSVRSHRS